jgi:hypothetical protein
MWRDEKICGERSNAGEEQCLYGLYGLLSIYLCIK